MIPYGRQDISEEDLKIVLDVLNSDFLTQGPMVESFEESISEFCKSKFSIATNSATSALHIACMSLELNKGDLFWTSPISYVASSNVALHCGAEIDFVDIDPDTFNICTINLEKKLQAAEKKGNLPKILMPVHMCGQPCDMKKIKELSLKYGFKIIEDASHAIGSFYEGSPTGNCKYSDLCVFSFHPVKIITTAEGGAVTTNDENLFKKLSMLRSHGVTKDKNMFKNISDGDWYYEQQYLGLNYRLTDIQAALGFSQMKRLTDFVKTRNNIAEVYNSEFAETQIRLPKINENILSSFHLYVIRTMNDDKSSRKELFDLLRKNNIGVNVHYMPIYRQPYYQKFNFNSQDFPNSENYYNSALSIPMYPKLNKKDQMFIVEIIKEAVSS